MDATVAVLGIEYASLALFVIVLALALPAALRRNA
ncbi:disulfide bond formation protein B [Bordetella pertussis]|nr:disulfide bond formation protein B [Bordetella pertussis]